MKHIMSVSLDEDTIIKLRELLRSKNFRNKSHAVEQAILGMHENSINNKSEDVTSDNLNSDNIDPNYRGDDE